MENYLPRLDPDSVNSTEKASETMAETNGTDSVVIERILQAWVERVRLMWTDPVHVAQWYGPDGAIVHVAVMDLSIGGTRLVRMEVNTPAGPRQVWFIGQHREVAENKRLVYTESMADEHGSVVAPQDMGMPPDYAVTTEIVVELQDLGAERGW